jgi:hypothetical protein
MKLQCLMGQGSTVSETVFQTCDLNIKSFLSEAYNVQQNSKAVEAACTGL